MIDLTQIGTVVLFAAAGILVVMIGALILFTGKWLLRDDGDEIENELEHWKAGDRERGDE